MRILNLDGRAALEVDGGARDIATASGGRFGPDIASLLTDWDDFRACAQEIVAGPGELQPIQPDRLGPPVPFPRQVFAIGLNYAAHAVEGGAARPDRPMVFTKFPAAVTGPYDDIELPPGAVDFEVELVVVMGRYARHIPEERAWDHVAGLTAGQDVSERLLQVEGPAPQQHCLAKSHQGFAPIGPALVTLDEVPDRDDIGLQTELNGEVLQDGRTSDMLFPIPRLIAYLSRFLPLLPGDLIFTGTPAGIGWTRTPQRLLGPGDELTTRIEHIGVMTHKFVPAQTGLVLEEAGDVVAHS